MSRNDPIMLERGGRLIADARPTEDGTDVTLQLEDVHEPCVLHWGVEQNGRRWLVPPRSQWPAQSRPVDGAAVQTPFSTSRETARPTVALGIPRAYSALDFVLFFPAARRWDNNRGRDYHVVLPPGERGPARDMDEALAREAGGRRVVNRRLWQLPGNRQLGAVVCESDGTYRAILLADVAGPLVLHWGVAGGSGSWTPPRASLRPAGTESFGADAARTPFFAAGGRQRLELDLPAADAPPAILFVLFQPDAGRWLKDAGRDFRVQVGETPDTAGHPPDIAFGDAPLDDLAQKIIEGETGQHSWTLMHRFNLCHDLLGRIPDGDMDALSLVLVWLRFSALRQLDWQRNYNTQPRELAHAQDRLTLRLAERFTRTPAERPWLRLILSTVGQGGEGQRVRDEVLNIMHRHHIKEVSGHFMEEWHQKLHNNTTPDDVVICEAFLAFLAGDGNRDAFYRTLAGGGVTRERLRSYDRPIRSEPDFVPGLKDALLHDFGEFLRILRKLHSGTDLDAAMENARPHVDGRLAGALHWIVRHRGDEATSVSELVAHITDARQQLSARLDSLSATAPVRALVYLDLGLEELLRLAIERRVHHPLGIGELGALASLGVQNLELVTPDEELRACRRFWERVRATPSGDELWALRVDAATERIARRVTGLLDNDQRALQPKAELLGRAFHADAWAVSTFSEEVVRGRSAVVIPVLVRLLRRSLRQQYRLPPWQVISNTPAGGELQPADSLEALQGTVFSRPTIVLARKITGQEEIPIGVTGILTSQDVDMLSHVAIRARNAGVLFASCQDPDEFERVSGLVGGHVAMSVGASGDLHVRSVPRGTPPGTTPRAEEERARPSGSPRLERPAGRRAHDVGERSAPDAAGAVSSREFTDATVGAKARNLVRLEGALPDWIHMPVSVAIPFGAFERVLHEPANRQVAQRYHELTQRLGRLDSGRRVDRARLLDELRQTVAALNPPDQLLATLWSRLAEAGVASPDPGGAWPCIKRVWASKWNERAFLSREANGIDHDAASMAVLVQPVVDAQYAFVIHTANPSTGSIGELYAEMVVGAGETLVGNHPGRAFSFEWRKRDAGVRVMAFPSKSCGLFGGGLIFRSDSNVEDLTGYAGAGLYDSVTLVPARTAVLDYTDEPLVWDDHFRDQLAARVGELGAAVERALGGPQDIEGAYARGEWWVLQARPQVGLRRG